MRYFKLVIAYDGTDFHGWQVQANKPTIQGEIINVLRRITQENVQLHGAGRTDAGVHALGQVASYRTSELQSRQYLVCRLLLEKKKNNNNPHERQDNVPYYVWDGLRQRMRIGESLVNSVS